MNHSKNTKDEYRQNVEAQFECLAAFVSDAGKQKCILDRATNYKLGQYITQEYGLLKQILSYLSAKELLNGKNVCRRWAEVVDVILAEENKPVWGYSVDMEAVKWSHKSYFQTIPRVIFYYTSGSTRSDCKQLEICPCAYENCPTELVLIEDELLKRRGLFSHESGCYDFMSCSSWMLSLPSISGVEVTSYVLSSKDPIFNKEVTYETLNQVIGKQPIKCLMLYTYKLSFEKTKWIESFLKELYERQINVAIGGGDTHQLSLLQGKGKCEKKQIAVFIVILKGDNVTAHSRVLSNNKKSGIDQFMKQMADDVGPIPSGSERLAFIVKCVNRCCLWNRRIEDKIYEGKKFKEAFPGVPHYGFLGYGEYGIDASSTDPVLKKRKKSIEVVHRNTTSFVILTLHNVYKSRKTA